MDAPVAISSERTKRRRRRRSIGGLVGLLALIVTALAAPSASAQPWECTAFGYLFQSPNVLEGREVGPHPVEQVDLATGDVQTLVETEQLVNATGYNQVDNYMYGLSQTEPVPGEIDYHLVRINSDGSLEELPWPVGLPLDFASVVGDVDPEGHYWLAGASSAGAEWAEIDLNTEPPTLIDSGPRVPVPGLSGGADWAWINGGLYRTAADPTTHEMHLIRFDPVTHTEADVTPAGLGFSVTNPDAGTADSAGAVYADASGYLYASYNGSGEIWRIDPVTHQVLKIANGPKAGSNDGARCASAPIPTVTVTKTVGGRVRPADQFTVGLVNPKGESVASASTTGPGTTASTSNFPASQNQTYTITDAMAPGSPSAIGEYASSIVCKDAEGNLVPTGGSGPNWTLPIANATFYTCNVTNKPVADLALTKESSPTPVVPGEEATFKLKVANKGPSASIGETITDHLPKEFKFVSASQGCAEANGFVSCQVGELAPGASRTFEINGKVASSLEHCLENTATVSGVHDPFTADNTATHCAPIEGRADLSIEKKRSAESVPVGGQIMYTLVIENDGPSDATGVRVEDPLAAHLTLVSAEPSQGSCSTAGGQVSCGLGRLVAGGSAQVVVTAVAGTVPGPIANKAKVRGDQIDPDPKDNEDTTTITVTPGPPQPAADLRVNKRASTAKPFVGQRMSFRIVVVNKGPAAASGVDLTDTWNAPVKVVSVKTSAGSCKKGLPLRCELGTIAAGARVTIRLVAKPRETGCWQRNAASATGAGADPMPGNNLDVVKLCVKKVKLKVSKTANRSSVPAGGTLGYVIRVKNLTKGVAKNVRVCDRLPNGMAFLSSSPKGKLRKGQLCWRIKQLGPKASKRFRVVARALKGSSGRKVNRATATSPDAGAAAKARSAVRVDGGGASPAGGVTG